jgi:peptide/nickel transport system permease protein
VIRYMGGRLLQAVANILFVATLIFVLERATGDPTETLLPAYAPPSEIAQVKRNLGLNKSELSQYVTYLNNLLHLNFGNSFTTGQPVTQVLAQHFIPTLSLCVFAFGVSVVIGIPLGVLAALHQRSIVDTTSRGIALFGQSMPPFYMSIVLVLIFGVTLRWLPVAGRGGLDSYIMPSVALAAPAIAGLVRLTRSSMLDALDSDFVRMAYAKGLPRGVIVVKHALRNASIPLITYAGLVLAGFLGGAVAIESIFNWQGIGQMTLDAVQSRDFPVLQGAVILVAACFIAVNLFVDLLYVIVDPRIKIVK